MKMTLLEFLTKVCKENYRPKKIVFEDVIFEPITKAQRHNNEEENENPICQYTSATQLLDGLDDQDMADYKSLLGWLMFGSWVLSDEENLLDFDKLIVTILEE